MAPTEPHDTGCYLKVVSNNSGVVTVVCNGVTYVSGVNFTLTVYGHAYYGEINVTGLTELKYYDWTVSQGAFTDSGWCNRLPKIGEPHKVVLYSCDNNTNFSNLSGAYPETIEGDYDAIKSLLDAGVFISLIIGIDDFSGYVDSKVINDTTIGGVVDATCTGWQATTSIQTGGDANDASLAYLAYYGCLGSTNIIEYDDLTLNVERSSHWGRGLSRAYVRNRIPRKIISGDHEYLDDIGFETNVQAGNNPRWDTYQVTVGEGETAFQKMTNTLGNTICNSGANDAHANHWVIKAGNIRFIAADHVANASGGIGSYNNPSDAQMTTVLGANQIADFKAEIASENYQFTLPLFAFGMMYCADGAVGENGALAQHPLFNHCLAEFQSLFTNTTDGFASNAYMNGALGTMVPVSGDLHRRNVLQYLFSAYTGNDEFAFDHWHTGTVNGSSNFLNNTGLSVGDTYSDIGGNASATLLHDETGNVATEKLFSFIIVEDIPAGKPILRMSHVDTEGNIVYQRDYTTGKGNYSKEIGLSYKQGISVASDEV